MTDQLDDFGVKYVRKKHSNHLINSLKKHYTVAKDWEGENYSGITLYWDYTNFQVHFYMPKCVKDSLIRFQHTLRKLTDQLHKHTILLFGATIKYAKAAGMFNKLDDDGKMFIQ